MRNPAAEGQHSLRLLPLLRPGTLPREGVDGGAMDSEQDRLEHCRQDSLGLLVDSHRASSTTGGLRVGARPTDLALGKGPT